MFTTPILFLIFNRPDVTVKVFDQIRKVKPAQLYIAADGARANKPGEADLCQHVREVVMSAIDWKCEVKTLFREENLGCKKAVSSAINWFFGEVEMGIVLEDDCLPDPTFFPFCQQLLNVYKDDRNVIAINGCNFNFSLPNESYFFSRYFNAWGWASWRRAAINVDYGMTTWVTRKKFWFLWRRLKKGLTDFDLNWYRYWVKIFDTVVSDELNTWDYQWNYRQWETDKKTIVPGTNLVTNIGFDPDATHTTLRSHPASKLPVHPMAFPLKKPCSAKFNLQYETDAVKPIWHLYKPLPNRFYVNNCLLKFALVSKINAFRKKIF